MLYYTYAILGMSLSALNTCFCNDQYGCIKNAAWQASAQAMCGHRTKKLRLGEYTNGEVKSRQDAKTIKDCLPGKSQLCPSYSWRAACRLSASPTNASNGKRGRRCGRVGVFKQSNEVSGVTFYVSVMSLCSADAEILKMFLASISAGVFWSFLFWAFSLSVTHVLLTKPAEGGSTHTATPNAPLFPVFIRLRSRGPKSRSLVLCLFLRFSRVQIWRCSLRTKTPMISPVQSFSTDHEQAQRIYM